MKRHFTCSEALEMVMQPDSSTKQEDSSDSPPDTTSSDSDPDFVAPPSSSSPSSSTEDEEDTEDTEDTEDPGSGWVGKNGQVWFPTNTETTHFTQPARGLTPGPTHYAIVRVHNLESAFNLFFTTEMMDLIIKMTNLNGNRTAKSWTNVDSTELRAYFGLLILAGVYRSKGESTRCLWDDRSGRAIFRATMPLFRFHEINASLRFDKLERPARHREDKLAPIRSLWEMWTHRLPLLFNPGKDVTVDEQLVPFKGRCKFRQYMPKKPAKYGLKIWVTADVTTSYAWKCDIYLGKMGDAAEVGQGKRVVLEMTEGLQGVTVTCDNFFTSYTLAQELLQRKVTLVGTIRKNKPELPPNLVQTKGRATLSSVFCFTKNTTAVSYLPRRGRNVILLSTKHREAAVTEGPKMKPDIIIDYNRCKGGVDNLDKVVGTYSTRRRTNRWPQALFFNMIDVSAYNAFIIFTAVDPFWNQTKKFKRRLFLEELGNALVSAAICRRRCLPHAPVAAALVREIQAAAAPPDPEPQPPAHPSSSGVRRGSCKWCAGRKKRTFATCALCGAHTCREHQVTCCISCCS
ncbi:piggyBac transposable element-derived protein 4-like [Cheilinus undulatus]|uniref:piggyBac transposable element-derived protein 4-like n=1 Tax=Cheilinus undulatus TaxID=241271 RepID=UPI001BD4BBC7|nr:piggyBac transposable element-derived protein 4-like [Cheilinus undulatus]XP_041653754.1 piggyBac transposable element-derived protein 4-like [Cheilinus undulatus]XP_041653755.1 piggyBac transposable element-derived protein 4-like [Cheilinus undulatus]